MKNRKLVKIISNVTLGIGVVLFAYYIFIFFTNRASLPSDVCPFDTGRPFAFASAFFLVISLIFSFFEEKKPKKDNETKEDK